MENFPRILINHKHHYTNIGMSNTWLLIFKSQIKQLA